MTRWVDVHGYEGLYQVSDKGSVRSLDRVDCRGHKICGRELVPEMRHTGHLRVTLSKDGLVQRLWVHRLVLEAFVAPRPDEQEGCHNDGNPLNNNVSNLRWGTKKSNAKDRVLHGNDFHARKTHCAHGHAYNRANTRLTRQGWRVCKTCTRSRGKTPQLIGE